MLGHEVICLARHDMVVVEKRQLAIPACTSAQKFVRRYFERGRSAAFDAVAATYRQSESPGLLRQNASQKCAASGDCFDNIARIDS
jgi:hypothetical protein